MSISRYLCFIAGENFQRAERFHPSTQKRLVASALAIHIPVLLWLVTSFVISTTIFDLQPAFAASVTLFCGLTIYLVERIVLATPKNPIVNLLRIAIGLVIALLGASAFDLVIFDREITDQLRANSIEQIQLEHEKEVRLALARIEQAKVDWKRAQEAANCEANGQCGSRIRSLGPIYRALLTQAEALREDYLLEVKNYEASIEKNNLKIEEIRASIEITRRSGLLARVKALADYTSKDATAFAAWALILCLVLFCELMVVITKLAFGETVDDELDRIRESISQNRARAYQEAIMSPVREAKEMTYTAVGV